MNIDTTFMQHESIIHLAIADAYQDSLESSCDAPVGLENHPKITWKQ